jgi:hypothetical protein
LDVRKAEDRDRFVAAAGLDPARVASPIQVHGAAVVRVDGLPCGRIEADGLVTATEGLALLLKAADCSLVAVADRARRAVGVAHAGWRGAAAGVVEALVLALAREFGSRPEDLVAGVGPTIGAKRYAVGAEVLDAFRRRVRWADECAREIEGRLHFDVARANALALEECGVATVEVADLCTFDRPELLFSYRRQGPGAGHHGLLAGFRRG